MVNEGDIGEFNERVRSGDVEMVKIVTVKMKSKLDVEKRVKGVLPHLEGALLGGCAFSVFFGIFQFFSIFYSISRFPHTFRPRHPEPSCRCCLSAIGPPSSDLVRVTGVSVRLICLSVPVIFFPTVVVQAVENGCRTPAGHPHRLCLSQRHRMVDGEYGCPQAVIVSLKNGDSTQRTASTGNAAGRTWQSSRRNMSASGFSSSSRTRTRNTAGPVPYHVTGLSPTWPVRLGPNRHPEE